MSDTPPPACRRCEYWMPGSLNLVWTAAIGECLNPASDALWPPADHCCPQFSEDPHEYERSPVRAARRAVGHGR